MRTCNHEHMTQPHWLPVLEQKPAYNESCRIQREEHTTKNTEGIISAKTVCTVSSSYLCTFIAFSPCGELLGLMGTLLIPSPEDFYP